MKYLNFFYIFCFCLFWGNSFGNPIGQVTNENEKNNHQIPAILLVELSSETSEKLRLDIEMFEKEQKENPSPEPSSTLGLNNLFQRYLAFSKNVTLLLLSPFRIPQVLQPSFSFLPSLPKIPSLNIPNSVYPSFMFHPFFTTGGSEIPDIPVDTSKFVLPLPVPAKVESPKKPGANTNEHNFVQDPLPISNTNKQNANRPHQPPARPNKIEKVPVPVQAAPIQVQVTPIQLAPAKEENVEKVPVKVPVPVKNPEKVPVEQLVSAPASVQVQHEPSKDEKVPTILIQHFNPVLIQHAPAPTKGNDIRKPKPEPVAVIPNKKDENDQIVPVEVEQVEQEISPEETPDQVEVDLTEVEKSPEVETISDANTSIVQNEKTTEDKPETEPEQINDESKIIKVENDVIDQFFSHPSPEQLVEEPVSLYTSTATTVFKPNEPIVGAEPESLFIDVNGKVVEQVKE